MPADNSPYKSAVSPATELTLRVSKSDGNSPVGVDLVSDEQGTTVIKRVKDGGLLAEAGALNGDILLHICGEPVRGAKQAARQFSAAKGSFDVVVQRAASQRTASERG